MKRIAGSFLLLAGLSGCISVTSSPKPGEPTANEVKSPPTMTQAMASPAGPDPTYAHWQADPGHILNGSVVDTKTARATPPSAAPLPDGVAANAVPLVQQPPPAPRPMPGRLGDMPSLLPVVVTPPRQTDVVQTSCVAPQETQSAKIFTDKTETPVPVSVAKSQIPVPPVPIVKDVPAGESKVAMAGPPLVRLVNTKRITLNFEVKDVGPSGLASVELWYTKDGHSWQKHDAPTKAKAYVVEVDGEGMYGFTLLARSGTGMGRERPAAGDQPQVWVIVDLTKPEVHLNEVTASMNQQQQQLTVKWSASDRNLGHRPIAIFYSEKPEGPWKVMATNLENIGTYVWPVPSDAPQRFLVKVEATDLAGNVGAAQSPPPAVLDARVPTVSIVAVEGNGTH